MHWQPPKIEDADSWTAQCIGCNEFQVEEIQINGEDAMQSLGKVVRFDRSILCMKCLNNIYNEAFRAGLVGGADGL